MKRIGHFESLSVRIFVNRNRPERCEFCGKAVKNREQHVALVHTRG